MIFQGRFLHTVNPLGIVKLVVMLYVFIFFGNIHAATFDNTDLGEKLSESRFLIEDRRFEEAIIMLEEINSAAPNNVEVLYLLGRAFESIKNYQRSLPLLQKAVELSPGVSQIKMDLARLYYNTGDYDNATRLLRELLSKIDNKALRKSILKDLSNVTVKKLLEENKLQEVLEFLQTSILLFPNDPKIYQQLGRVYASIEFWDEAENAFNVAENKSSGDKSAIRIDRVLLYKKQGDKNKQTTLLKQLLNESRDSTAYQFAYNSMIESIKQSREVSEFEEANREIDALLVSDPNDSQVQLLRAELLIEEKKYDEAALYLQSRIKNKPNDLSSRKVLAELYLKQNDLENAIFEYEQLKKQERHPDRKQAIAKELSRMRSQKAREFARQSTAGSRINSYLTQIDNWISDDDLDPAFLFLNSIINKRSKSGPANYLLGKAYAKKQQFQLAKKYLTRAIYLKSENIEYYLYFANLLAETGDTNAAIQVYKNLMSITDDEAVLDRANKEIGFVIGKQLINLGRTSEALTHFRGLSQEYPGDEKILANMALLLSQLGQLAEANKINNSLQQKRGVELSLDDSINRAKAFMQAGNLDAAMSLLKSLYEQSPENSKVLYWIGNAYAQKKKIPEAIHFIEQSVRFSPTNNKLKMYLARLYAINGELDKSAAIYQALLALSPNETESLNLRRQLGFVRGQELLNQKAYDKALGHFNKLVVLFPEDLKVLDALSVVYGALNMNEELLRNYLKILRINPQRVATYLQLANLYEKQGEKKKQRIALSNVIKYDKSEGVARRKAVKQLLDAGKQQLINKAYENALPEFQAILNADDEHIAANVAVAETFQLMGENKKAEQGFIKVLALQPLNHHIRTLLASFYAKQGRLDDAISEYRKIVTVSKNDEAGRKARANLNILYQNYSDKILAELDENSNPKEIVDVVKQWILENRINSAFKVLDKLAVIFPEDEQVQYWLGSIYDRKKNFEPALQFIGRSVELAPENPRLRSAYARVLARAGKFEEAEAQYVRVIQLENNPEFVSETRKLLGFLIGQRLISESRLEDALAHYKEMQNDFPNDMGLFARMATVHMNLDNLNTAEKYLQQIITVQPDSPAVHLQLAQVYKRRNNTEAYKNELRQVILLDPDGLGVSAANELGLRDGQILMSQGKWQEAIGAFDQVLETDANNSYALVGISAALIELGNYTQAEKLLLLLLSQDATNIRARLQLARLLVKTKRIGQAVVELERIIFVAGDTDQGQEAKLNLANIYRTQAEVLGKGGDLAGAIKQYLRAVSRDPDDVKAQLALAAIFQRDKRYYRNAVNHYEEALRVDPSNYRAWMNVGALYEKLQNYDKAMHAYSYALSNVIEDSTSLVLRLVNAIRIQVVRLQLVEKNYPWIIVELQEMLEIEPNSARLNIFLSSVYTTMQEYELAIESLQNVIAIAPNNSLARYRLGVLYERVSEDELALAQYRSILRAKSADNLVERARDRIPVLEDRVKNFNYSLTYSVSSTRTSYLNTDTLVKAFNSNLLFDFTTRFRPTKDLNISFRIAPTYSALHESQNDSLAPSYNFTGQYNTKSTYFTGSINYRETKGVLLEDFRGNEFNANISAAQRLQAPLLLTDNEKVLPQTLQYRLVFRKFDSDDITYFDTRSISPSVTFTYPLLQGGSITAGFTYSDTQNTHIFGGDYANKSSQLTLGGRLLLASKLSGSINTAFEYQKYKNYDSHANFGLRKVMKRETARFTLSARLDYQFNRRLSVFGSIAAIEYRSNINSSPENPAYIWGIGSDGNPVRVGFQSLSISDNRSLALSSGVRFRF